VFEAWTLGKLAPLAEERRVLVRDPLRLLPETSAAIDGYAREQGYTVVVASTNLAFRYLYQYAREASETGKLLVIDRAPRRPGGTRRPGQAPPPFYPDLLAETPARARIELNLRTYLSEETGDANWPAAANEPRYARLIRDNLERVVQAHRNLRAADKQRFTDEDFKRIVAYAALGVPEAAFRRLRPAHYWRIGLIGHEALAEMGEIAPEITRPLREALRRAPPPFSWLETGDPEVVVRAVYLAVIVAQHVAHWALLLGSLDSELRALEAVEAAGLREAVAELTRLDAAQAERDLEAAERSLDAGALQRILVDEMRLNLPERWAEALEREHYSTLVRSLALLMALDDLLGPRPAAEAHARVGAALDGRSGAEAGFVERREAAVWSNLKEAYALAAELPPLRGVLAEAARNLPMRRPAELTFEEFRALWNDRKLNRLEYFLSALERRTDSGTMLPRQEEDLPRAFTTALASVRKRVREITEETRRQLLEVNRRFQDLVKARYPTWIANDGEVYLTSQFLRRCLKAHWDPATEKAVVLVFDGMRYDIWDELLKPMLLDRMEVIAELPASALLPSETHVSRWALAAGAAPDTYYNNRGAENDRLQEALAREFRYSGSVTPMAPEGSGTGETIRYQAGNLEYIIFEFCDTELHGIELRRLSDGRRVPSRPLAFVYEQHLKNLIDHEIMAVVRRLAPGMKVFVTADHGFGPITPEQIQIQDSDVYEQADCTYLHASLRVPFAQANLQPAQRGNVIAFTPTELRMPVREQRQGSVLKEFRAIVFPRAGYAFRRPNAGFRPDAYTHGGISLQELIIPMVALRVKPREEGALRVEEIEGPEEAIEGTELVFRLGLRRSANAGEEEIRVEVEASFRRPGGEEELLREVLYVGAAGAVAEYRLMPELAELPAEERRRGVVEAEITIAVRYREGRRSARQARSRRVRLRLNEEQVVRRMSPSLGNILGMTTKRSL
jgi:hypothetical protein